MSVGLKGCGVDSEGAGAQVRAAVSQQGDVRVGPDTAHVGVSRDGVVVMAEDVVDVRACTTRLCTALDGRVHRGAR